MLINYPIPQVTEIEVVIFKLDVLGAAPEQCPVDFPKAFNYGKSCCHYDKDNEDNIISSPSLTCKDDFYLPCQKDHCIDNSNTYDYIILDLQIRNSVWKITYLKI